MRRAVAVFQGGDLVEAERICKAILGVQRDHFDALHVLGLVKHGKDTSRKQTAC